MNSKTVDRAVNYDPVKKEVFPDNPKGPSFSFETIHISCESDAYQGTDYNYAGVIIYAYDGKTKWETRNGTRCKGGYLVIKDTGSRNVTEFRESDRKVHGAVYRSAFGEEHNCTCTCTFVGIFFTLIRQAVFIELRLNRFR